MAQVVHVETLRPIADYTQAQLILACAIQRALNRGVLVLVERPWGS